AESADRFAELTRAPVRAIGAGHDDLRDGDRVRVGGLEIVVVATPGHTADSLSFLLPAENLLLTGDTVLGRGSTVVAHPDGELAAYLSSLGRLEAMTGSGEVTSIAPGHGPTVSDAAGTVRWYLDHRRERLDQVRDALAAGAAQAPDVADAVVERVYADVPREVWPAARLSVLAQLDYLRDR
uniref:MBL fold metallo-hydrolase n=1 Tax=Segeticoccus rhizosphaerae TaxID=1104777 RepID=UPI0012645429